MRERMPRVSVRYKNLAGKNVKVTADFKTKWIGFQPYGKPEIRIPFDKVFELIDYITVAKKNLGGS
jgi:hypothetical protein